jgi:folate-binding protein YgfZ
MSGTIEQTIYESPLAALHEAAGAEMVERDGVRLPASFGDAEREYEAVRGGGEAGAIDLTPLRATLTVEGGEAEQFLNGMVTNDVARLEVGAWMLAAFPNVQGRLIGFARFLRLRSDKFLLDTDRLTHARILSTLERFTLAGDFRVSNRDGEMIVISIQGRRAKEIINSLFDTEAASLANNRINSSVWHDSNVTIIRDTHTGEDGFDLFVETSHAPTLWNAFIESGARPIGFDTLETLRIEAGLPRYGADMNETNVVLETGQDRAVSFTKGCYLGQEIIARIHFRGHVARRIAGLRFDGGDSGIERDAVLKSIDGKDAGRITSVVRSPRLNETIALASVRYAYLAPGTELIAISGQTETKARVVELPFI